MNKKNKLVFKAETLIPVILEARKNQCSLLLVKDHGVYIMPEICQHDENERYAHVAFAIGCHPDIDEGWYDYAHDLMGGDDSCDRLDPLDPIFDLVVIDKQDLCAKFTAEDLDLFI